MSYGTLLNSSVVQTRKLHRCWGCWHLFPKGSILLSQSIADSDGIQTVYCCQDCLDVIRSNPDLVTDEMLPGEIGYWKNEKWHIQSCLLD